MAVVFLEKGLRDFDALDNSVRILFKKHLQKLLAMPPRRHLGRGLPYFCENVTEQARLVYQMAGEDLLVLHCFATHKEYERWYRGVV